MHNLKPCNKEAFSLYKEAVSRKHSGPSKTRLLTAERNVQSYYAEYERRYIAGTLHGIHPKRVTGPLYKDLFDLYDYDAAIVKEIRESIKKNNPISVYGICQYCGLGGHDTMDHILPHTKYAEYAVHAKNLIPCCTDCNRRKNERELLNLYTDILPDVEYLFMDVSADGDTIDLSFRLDNAAKKVEAGLFQKIASHYGKLELFDRMKTMANARLTAFVIQISGIYDKMGKNSVIEIVMENIVGLRKAYGYNCWEVAFQKGLLNSPVFWDYYEQGKLI